MNELIIFQMSVDAPIYVQLMRFRSQLGEMVTVSKQTPWDDLNRILGTEEHKSHYGLVLGRIATNDNIHNGSRVTTIFDPKEDDSLHIPLSYQAPDEPTEAPVLLQRSAASLLRRIRRSVINPESGTHLTARIDGRERELTERDIPSGITVFVRRVALQEEPIKRIDSPGT
jgi:hypothetical protein